MTEVSLPGGGEATEQIKCPGRCTPTDHEAEFGCTHYGPTFGLVQTEVLDGDAVGCLGQNGLEALDDLTAEQLRQLAADALRAAAWMEQQSDCPSWCTGDHKDVDLVDDGSTYHPGPSFGRVSFAGVTNPDRSIRELNAVIEAERGATTPAGLRQLAADVFAGADWLEAQARATDPMLHLAYVEHLYGIRIRQVADFEDRVLILTDRRLVLIDESLTVDEYDRLTERLSQHFTSGTQG